MSDDADSGDRDGRGDADSGDRDNRKDADSGERDNRKDADSGDRDDRKDADRDPGSYPIEGTALVKTAALASVPAARVPALLARVQADLGPRIDAYRRRYERVAVEPDRETFLVEPDHWNEVADRVGLSKRERDAVVRAHETEVERIGAGSGRRAEFETALEIRSGVVIGVDDGRNDDCDADGEGAEADSDRDADGD